MFLCSFLFKTLLCNATICAYYQSILFICSHIFLVVIVLFFPCLEWEWEKKSICIKLKVRTCLSSYIYFWHQPLLSFYQNIRSWSWKHGRYLIFNSYCLNFMRKDETWHTRPGEMEEWKCHFWWLYVLPSLQGSEQSQQNNSFLFSSLKTFIAFNCLQTKDSLDDIWHYCISPLDEKYFCFRIQNNVSK